MLKPVTSSLSRWPILPQPMIPRVFPESSVPSKGAFFHVPFFSVL